LSEIIELANSLRKSSNEFLVQLLASRQISSNGFRDFLDFATALGENKSLKATICALPRSQAQTLVALCSGVKPEALARADLQKLQKQMLVLNLLRQSIRKT